MVDLVECLIEPWMAVNYFWYMNRLRNTLVEDPRHPSVESPDLTIITTACPACLSCRVLVYLTILGFLFAYINLQPDGLV